MISLLFRNWKLILDIILVIALVVLFFFWNPFGIFGSGLQLKPTTNLLAEVRGMGQLVTSEYYGEVIATIEESRMNRIEEEEISVRASRLYDHLYQAAADLLAIQAQPLSIREAELVNYPPIHGGNRLIRQSVSRRNIVQKLDLYQLLDDLSTDPLFEDLLEYTWKRQNNNRQWNAQNRQKEEAMYIIYNDVENKRNPALDEGEFSDFYYQNKARQTSRKDTKKKLAMVGRGWVKAGFDFSQLDNNTFYINEGAGEVHFFGLSPVILNAEINPWFIPEKGIPGFEILDYNGKVDFRDAKKVKQYCIEKLILNAHRTDILTHAENQGAETLKNLFSLVTGTEIKKVLFHNDRMIQLVQEIAADEYVDYHEASLLDSLIGVELKVMDSLRKTPENSFKNQQLANHRQKNTSMAIAQLRKLPFQDLSGTFSYFSKRVFEMARDSILDDAERQQLENMRRNWEYPVAMRPAVDSLLAEDLWFSDHFLFVRDYNLAIETLLQEVVPGSVEEMTLLRSDFNPVFLEENWVQNYTFFHPDSVEVRLVKEDSSPHHQLLDQLYPFQYHDQLWEADNLWSDSIAANNKIISVNGDSGVWVYWTGSADKVRKLTVPVNKLMNPYLLKKWGEDNMIWISPNLCFIRGGITRDAIKAPEDYLLTHRQSLEMEAFFAYMVKRHREKKNKGPVVQAHEWVKNKFADNKSVGEWFSGVKNKLAPRWN